MLLRHYSGCRADAIAAVKGWRERLKEQRIALRTRLPGMDPGYLLCRRRARRQPEPEGEGTRGRKQTGGQRWPRRSPRRKRDG